MNGVERRAIGSRRGHCRLECFGKAAHRKWELNRIVKNRLMKTDEQNKKKRIG